MSPRAAAPRRRRTRAGTLLALAAALLAAGCGTSHELVGNRISGRTLTIYTSLPLQGASGAGGRAVLDGEQLALSQARGRVGQFGVRLRALDDATVARGGWDPGQTTLNVAAARQDASTIAYIGDFNSGASAIAIPPLNRLGILTISPTSTAVGLTTDGPSASPGEPAKYYPTGQRTFVRLSPDDGQQASAQLRLQRALHCTRTYLLDDGDFDGYAAANAFQLAARAAGRPVIGLQSFQPQARDYTSLALAVAQLAPDCVLISALPESHAALLATQLAAHLPQAKLFLTAPLAQPSVTNPDRGGVPLSLDSRVFITAPAGDPVSARAFDRAFTQRYGAPGPYAVYGYEAMRLVLAAIARATGGGHDDARRSAVLGAALHRAVPTSALGPFTVHADGTTSLRSYGVFTLQNGVPVLWYELS